MVLMFAWMNKDAHTLMVLMFAWMNKDALHETLVTNRMTFWSRTRQKLWVKGETSGHNQRLYAMTFDCDGDAILCQVVQQGAACHTGRATCFYLQVDGEAQQVWIDSDHA
ncbi:MAG: phosphoribosyl-AMP cyclohydrolase [Porticoccaceae bacterium]|nr:phosphoribosyl-AMP cyclohydrolase [Porticoccaceae bacterium]